MAGMIIVGGGGHGKVIADLATTLARYDKVAFLDSGPAAPQAHSRHDAAMMSRWPIIGTDAQAADLVDEYAHAFIAIGNNMRRWQLYQQYHHMGFEMDVLIHPSASVSQYARVNDGSTCLPNSVVHTDANVGAACIINSGAIVEHDCILGHAVHIAPNATLAGGVNIGDFSWVGMGASILENVRIGSNVMIGAGAVIVDDVPDNVTIVGVPGKIRENASVL